jgi:hypothetical protein
MNCKTIPPFEAIYTMENLYSAWHKVSLGKSNKSSILEFYLNLDQNLESIANDLRNKTYLPGSYNYFLIKDPKERGPVGLTGRDGHNIRLSPLL